MLKRRCCGVFAVLLCAAVAGATAEAPKAKAVPADEAWTEAVRFADRKGKLTLGWTWRRYSGDYGIPGYSGDGIPGTVYRT